MTGQPDNALLSQSLYHARSQAHPSLNLLGRDHLLVSEHQNLPDGKDIQELSSRMTLSARLGELLFRLGGQPISGQQDLNRWVAGRIRKLWVFSTRSRGLMEGRGRRIHGVGLDGTQRT